jgi:nucleoside-diphosphate-sugar epimerase
MKRFKSIFLTGGAGYVGSCLVPYLLNEGYNVTVYDIMYFGNYFLPTKNKNLKIISGDIRNQSKIKTSCENHDVFINLACISNDSSFVLDRKLSKSINYDSFEPMVRIAKRSGVKRFIHASTSSVYGVSNQRNVKEDHPLVPLTDYNKYKAMVEPILLNNLDNNFEGVIFRPATVCGYAPRQRLDLSVNILTNFAYNKSLIKVFGGDQLRPNLHIMDYCEVVGLFLKAEKKDIHKEIFNVGCQNLTINELALKVKSVVEKKLNKKNLINVIKSTSDDKRSYHINSDKIMKKLGYVPKRTIEMAVEDLCLAFSKNLLPNSFEDDFYFNVNRLKRINAK